MSVKGHAEQALGVPRALPWQPYWFLSEVRNVPANHIDDIAGGCRHIAVEPAFEDFRREWLTEEGGDEKDGR